MDYPRQRRLKLLEELGFHPELLRVSSAISCPSDGESERLALAFAATLSRHSLLRGCFSPGDQLKLEVGPDPEISRIESTSTSVVDAVQRYFRSLEPIAMSSPTLVRAAVIVGSFGTALALSAHRAMLDRYSLDHLLCDAVRGDSASAPASFDVLQFSNENDLAARAVARVRALFEHHVEPAELTGDRPRPAVFDINARSSSFPLEREALNAVKSLAAAHDGDEELILLSAFALLLARYTRRRDLLIGLRSRAEASRLVYGPLENQVPFHAHLGTLGQRSVAEFLARQADELAVAREFASVPFETLLEEIALGRDPSRAPLFQFEFASRRRPELPAGHAYLPLEPRATNLDLCLEIEQEPVGSPQPSRAQVIESLGLFQDPARPERLIGHLTTLLVGMAAHPERGIDALELVTPAERHHLVHVVNPQTHFFSEDTIAHRVERMARERPEAIAIVCGAEQLTYAELESGAQSLANRLLEFGVGTNDRVGICVERSVRLIVALYAILKAGGAYVPIEPTQPRERIEFVLHDSAPKVVLVEGDTLAGFDAPLLRIDLSSPADLFSPASRAGRESSLARGESPADALAYVIYTSGSTGRPKGCLVDHRHVIRLLDATLSWFHFDHTDVWTMFHSVAFDFSVWEIWGALSTGARLVVVPQAITRSPGEFHRLVVREGVTVLNQTPSAFRQLIDADLRVENDLALRVVIFGGEALELQSLKPWIERHGDEKPELVNMYGITETTVHVTYRRILRDDLDAGFASVIGVPIPDLRCYVVDEGLELAPIGVPGELLVSGAGVSRGYWQRQELTAERFLSDPFVPESGARMYRSGDLVRRLPSGELDYLGRIDQQVKIRGFRIEIGEVEAALRRSGQVQDVCVVAAKNHGGEAVLVAYVVSSKTPGQLRTVARAALPEYMVPSLFVRLPAIPMTGNGKVDRRCLPDPLARASEDDSEFIEPQGPYERAIAQAFSEVLGLPRVSSACHFFEQGGSSLGAVNAARRIGGLLEMEVPVLGLFEHASVQALALHLEALARTRSSAENSAPPRSTDKPARSGRPSLDAAEPIAIVGMSGRFPGAPDIDSLWHSLLEGTEGIRYFAPQELHPSLDPTLTESAAYVRARGVLDDVAGFDAGFFGLSPREAEVTDPQQRIALELAWEALESAGYDPADYRGAIGVFAGEYNVSYYTEHVLRRPDVLEHVGAFQAMLGNEKDFVATRIAHRLDLRGPAVSVHTACSTSLVAVVQAFHSLRAGECDMALAGGVSVTCPPESGYLQLEGSMLSPDGHTRPFDADGQGTVFSDGGGFVLLKRLSDAVRDRDTIWAVVRGAALNNDGAAKASFTAPSAAGQAAVIERALNIARVDPSSIGYVEGHGTATPLGDPIEVEGLTRAFRRFTSKAQFCGLGSIKSNFGHLTAAAGVAGLIKATLAVHHGVIPKTLHFQKPNPKLALERSPFFVVQQTTNWDGGGAPRRAGVSSFGVGGTNAHVVIEQAPASPGTELSQPLSSREQDRTSRPELLLLSARTKGALEVGSQRMARALEDSSSQDLTRAAFTLALGRRGFSERRFVVARTGEEARASLLGQSTSHTARARRALAFVFSGQASQYVAMGRVLARREPIFRVALDRCIEILKSGASGPGGALDLDLKPLLDPAPADLARAEKVLIQTQNAQPAIFAIEYALSELWSSLGLRPNWLLGHSIGEIVAACKANVLSLEDALRLVFFRGKLMQSAPTGIMLSVRAPFSEVEAELEPELAVAAINAPLACVISGPEGAISRLEQRLGERTISTRRLLTSHAFHSPSMDQVVDPFGEIVSRLRLSKPATPIMSTATGQPLSDAEAMDPKYWALQLRRTVRFNDALSEVWKTVPDALVLEIGPRATLALLGRQIATDPERQPVVASLDVAPAKDGAEADEEGAWLRAVGSVWSHGIELELESLFPAATRRLPLPTYAFEHKRYWIDPPAHEAARQPLPSLREPRDATLPGRPHEAVLMVPQHVPESKSLRALGAVRSVLEEASGVSLAHASPAATFNELGLDSLSLTQCAQLLAKRLGCKITFRQLSEELVSLGSLAAHLETLLPDEVTLASSLHAESSRTPLTNVPEPAALTFSHDAMSPPVPGARLGRDRHGNPAWYVPHPENPSKYVTLSSLVSTQSKES